MDKRINMHLQWFSDEDPSFEVDEDDAEIVTEDVVEEPKEAPEDDNKVTLTKDEYQKMMSGMDTAQAIQAGLANLKPANAPPPEQKSGESWSDFKQRVNKELFGDNPADILEEYLTRLSAPLVSQTLQATTNQSKKFLELDPDKGPTFKEYKKDIEAFYEGLTPQQKTNPDAWAYAYREVIANKQDEIIEKKVQAKLKEALEAHEKTKNIKVSSDKTYKTEGSGMVGNTVPKRKIKLSPDEKSRFEEEAEALGVPIGQVLRAYGKI